MPLDNETKKKIQHLSKPYPKSVNSSVEEHQAVQPGNGGSSPTFTHHSILSEDAG